MRRNTFIKALSHGAAGGVLLAAVGYAAPTFAAAAAASASGEPPEIVITAQKRSETQVNVPESVVAVSAAGLDKAGITEMHNLDTLVPAMHIDTSGAFFQPSIRGVGTAISGAGASANVPTYVDGNYKPNALSNDFGFLDVESVQVLKGPQGTLFGRNSTGGAILVTTKAPSFEPHLEAKVSYGSFNTFNGAVFATTGLVPDKLAVSVSLNGTRSDGWVHNTVTNSSANPVSDYSGRVKFLWNASDKWKVTLGVEGFHVDDTSSYAAASYNGWSDSVNFGVNLQSINTPRQVSLTPPIAHNVEGVGVTLKVEGDLGFAELTSYTSLEWDRGNEATNELAAPFPANGSLPASFSLPFAVTNADWHYHEETYTQEFDLAHKGKGPLDWVTGLFLYYDNTTYDPFNLGFYGPFGPEGAFVQTGDIHFSSFSTPTYSGALFADVTYNMGPWHFTIGGRGSVDKIEETFQGFAPFNVPQTLHGNHSFTSFTPRAIIRYSLTPESNLYVSYSEGTKAGLFNSSGFASQSTPLQPERLRDLEGGYKVSHGSWHFETSAFYYWYSNLQVATYEGGVAFLQNAPSAHIYGAEASVRGALTDFMDVSFAAATQHARYIDFKDAALQTFSPTLGVVNSTTDVSGGVMERQSPVSGDASIDFHEPIMGGRADFVATGSYQSASSFDFANTLRNPAHTLLNLRLSWTDPTKRWTIAGNAQNLLNSSYPVQVLPNAGGFGVIYGAPRAFNIELSLKY